MARPPIRTLPALHRENHHNDDEMRMTVPIPTFMRTKSAPRRFDAAISPSRAPADDSHQPHREGSLQHSPVRQKQKIVIHHG